MDWRVRKIELYAGFLIGSGLIILGALLVIQGTSRDMTEEYVKYTAFTPRAFGLREGSPVKMLDLAIGNVKSVGLTDEGSVKIELKVKKEFQRHIRQDLNNPDRENGTVFTLSSTGFDILGATIIMTPGKPSLPQLEPGSTLVYDYKPSPIDETLKSAKKLLETMTSESNSLGRFMNDKGSTFELMQAILKNINLTIESTRKKSDDLTDKAAQFITKTAALVDSMSSMMNRFEKVLEKVTSTETTIGAMLNDKKFYELLTSILDKTDKILARTQGNMDNFGKILGDMAGVTGQVPDLVTRLDQVLINAKEVTEALKKNFLIKPFLAQPPKEELLEITPR